MEEQNKEPNIFKQFALSFVPTQYHRLTKVTTGSMIGFVTLLVLAATLISFLFLAVRFASVDMEEVAAELPEFEISGGRLHLDEDFVLDEETVFIYMTEDIDGFSYEDVAELIRGGYQNVMLVGRDRLSIMQNSEYQQLDFSDLGNFEISRQWIVTTLAPLMLFIVAIGYVFLFVGKALWYFLSAAIYLLFGMFIASVMKKNVGTGALFRVAVYAKVLMFVAATFIDEVLNEILMVNFSIPNVARIAVTMVFMGFAIAKLPDEQPTVYAPMPPTGQGWQ
ncbi:MAG: DUF1189 domain-containing protein [Bacteroidales bacterium]|nr:DUF1189 domain-containing protein [Bacteroidales bacterium]MCM1416343.1 DUF1189 domain-containing protein [bacterium]MCM1423562.1 DUF1189 domain-containing protein [bacterium]